MNTSNQKENPWVKTSDRLPTGKDADAAGMVEIKVKGLQGSVPVKFSLVNAVTVEAWRRSSAG